MTTCGVKLTFLCLLCKHLRCTLAQEPDKGFFWLFPRTKTWPQQSELKSEEVEPISQLWIHLLCRRPLFILHFLPTGFLLPLTAYFPNVRCFKWTTPQPELTLCVKTIDMAATTIPPKWSSNISYRNTAILLWGGHWSQSSVFHPSIFTFI